MFTNRAKLLGGTIVAVIVVGSLAYGQYQNTKEIAKLDSNPVVVTKTVVVSPTVVPTATPSAGLKYTPVRASSAAATKGVK